MFLFGVTGGIGSGKSTVCRDLMKNGLPIIAADPLAKKLTNELAEIRTALVEQFGEDVYLSTGELNREYLSKFVFSDAQARERVNQIIHPHVLQAIQDRARQLHEEKQSLVGVEAALIYESGMEQILDVVVVVDAPLEKRIDWLRGRDGLSKDEILKRISAQIPIEEKIKRADYVINNNGDFADLESKVAELFQWLGTRLY